MPAKMARSAPRPLSGLPEVTVAVRTALLSCWKAGKTPILTPIREASGESRSKRSVDVGAPHSLTQADSSTCRASPRWPGRSRTARTLSIYVRRFRHLINADQVFGIHRDT